MKFSYPLAFTGLLGSTYSIGQEYPELDKSSLSSTETEILGYVAEMASAFDYKAQEKKYNKYQSVITNLISEFDPESKMPEAPSFSDMTNLALSTVGFETEVDFSRQGVECTACKWGSWVFRETVGSTISKDLIVGIGKMACPFVMHSLTGYIAATCNGILNQQFAESILPILVDDLMSERVFCTYQMEVCDMDKYAKIDVKETLFDLLVQKPPKAFSNDFINNLYKEHKMEFDTPGRESLKIVSISDLHIDYEYTVGATNDCGRPLCCRTDSGKPVKPEDAAQKWGDFKCDLNSITLDSMLSHIKNVIKPDLVLWGGDSIPHNVDSLTIETNVQIMK